MRAIVPLLPPAMSFAAGQPGFVQPYPAAPGPRESAITADTALRLGAYFGVAPEVWLRLQMEYEIRRRDFMTE